MREVHEVKVLVVGPPGRSRGRSGCNSVQGGYLAKCRCGWTGLVQVERGLACGQADRHAAGSFREGQAALF